MNKFKNNILFIGGTGRNGSTILAKILDESSNILNIGEAPRYFLNQRMQSRNIPCECGKMLDECSFWSRIKINIDPEILSFYNKEVKFKKIFKYLFSSDKGYKSKFLQIQNSINLIYGDTDNSLLVDTSKHPFHSLLVKDMDNFNIEYIHLVRSPYAFVSSSLKQNKYLKNKGNAFTFSFQWLYTNIFYDFFKFFNSNKCIKIFYEDFVYRPNFYLKLINKRNNLAAYDIKMLNKNSEIQMNIGHSLAGNPSKFSYGKTKIENKGYKLKFSDKVIVTLLCFPLIIKYYFEKKML